MALCEAGFHQVKPMLGAKALTRRFLLQHHPGSDIVWSALAREAVAVQLHAGMLQALEDVRAGRDVFSEPPTELCVRAKRNLGANYLVYHGEAGRAIRAALDGGRGSPVARSSGGKGGGKGWGQNGAMAGAPWGGANAGPPCRYFATTGTCSYGASCMYYHGGGRAPLAPPLLMPAGPSPMGPSPAGLPPAGLRASGLPQQRQHMGGSPQWAAPSQICRDFIKGKCFRGVGCKFKH